MYQKNLYIIPPAKGKTRFIVPAIISKGIETNKSIFWFTDKNNIEYCDLQNEQIITITAKEWKNDTFIQGCIHQIICEGQDFIKEIEGIVYTVRKDSNAIIIFDPGVYLLKNCINSILLDRDAADIHILFNSLADIYSCINENQSEHPEYKEKKFLDRCKKEYHTYEKNRIFWMDNMGVTKVRRKEGELLSKPTTRPLPTYQPYNIFNCTLFHYKIGSLPGMTIEEIISEIGR